MAQAAPTPPRPPVRQWLSLAATALALGVMLVGYGGWLGGWVREAQVPPAQATYSYNDFAEEIAAAGLLATPQRPQMYQIPVQLARQRAIWGPRYDQYAPLPFALVPWAAFVLVPLLGVPHAVAYLVFTAASVAAAGLAFALLARWMAAPRVVGAAFVLAGLASFPLFRTVTLGQFSSFALLAVTGMFLLLARGRATGAGLALAAATLKPHLIVLLPLALVLQGRWRALIAAAVGGAALVGLSVLIIGPQVLVDYPALIRDLSFSESVEQMPNWRGLFESTLGLRGPLLSATLALGLLLMTAAVVWAWWPARILDFRFWIAESPEGSGIRDQGSAASANNPKSKIQNPKSPTPNPQPPTPNPQPPTPNPHSWDLRWALTILATLLFSTHLHFNDLLLWAIPVAIVLRRVYAPPAAGALAAGERAVALLMVWGAFAVPFGAWFVQPWRLGLWFALAALGLLAWRIHREGRAAPHSAPGDMAVEVGWSS